MIVSLHDFEMFECYEDVCLDSWLLDSVGIGAVPCACRGATLFHPLAVVSESTVREFYFMRCVMILKRSLLTHICNMKLFAQEARDIHNLIKPYLIFLRIYNMRHSH